MLTDDEMADQLDKAKAAMNDAWRKLSAATSAHASAPSAETKAALERAEKEHIEDGNRYLKTNGTASDVAN